MLLYELFDHTEMTEQLRQAALDYLTPLLSQNVPFVTMNQIIEALRQNHFGVVINRAMIMELLDPDQNEAIGKIEGDRIYLQQPDAEVRDVDAEDAEKDQEQVTDIAQDQAKKSIEEPAPVVPPTPQPPTKA